MLNSDHKPIARAQQPLVPAFEKLAVEPTADPQKETSTSGAFYGNKSSMMTRRRQGGSTSSVTTACTFGAPSASKPQYDSQSSQSQSTEEERHQVQQKRTSNTNANASTRVGQKRKATISLGKFF